MLSLILNNIIMYKGCFFMDLFEYKLQRVVSYTKIMENDIEIDELARMNRQKQQKLKKMKSNIQKLQINMSKKFATNKSNLYNQVKEPATIYNHYQKQYSSTSPINTQKQFAFNSTLFKNINNQSQPIMENGSAVSNFSSVSNINNLLNGRFQPVQPDKRVPAIPQNKSFQKSKGQNNLLTDIDRLLEKSKNAKKMPIKAFQKFLDIKQSKQSKSFSQIEELQSSRYSDKKKDEPSSSKTKLQQYKKLIEQLDPIPEHSTYTIQNVRQNKEQRYQRHRLSDMSDQQVTNRSIRQMQPFIGHKKSQLSNFTNKSQYSQSKINFPPLPSSRPTTQNPVQRHKALIRQSFQERKKLETEVINQNLDKTQIDLELSDEQNEQQLKKQQVQKKRKIDSLLRQKELLLKELQSIEDELQTLQNQ